MEWPTQGALQDPRREKPKDPLDHNLGYSWQWPSDPPP